MRQRQVYEILHHQILSGIYPPGSRLPGSRQLSAELGASRMTLQTAVQQLVAEGLLITRPGSGIYVTKTVPDGAAHPVEPRFSAWAERLRHAPFLQRQGMRGSQLRSFAASFPYDIWRRMLGRYLSTDDAILNRYGSPAGFGPLREAIAAKVARLRGVNCTAEQVIIVSGIQQALDILARLLIDPGDEVVVENPGYVSAYRVFAVYGADLQPVAVDRSGMIVSDIPAESRSRLAFVTPANQFPRGGAMSLERRLALLEWARRQQALIIEDDYDGELRYDGQPLAALQSLDRDGRVIYLGTFSKVLFPALRLGYVILPDVLHRPFLHARQLLDRGAPTLTQAAAADFIAEGHFERHLKKLRQLYRVRRQLLVESLQSRLGSIVRFTGEPAGLHVWLTLTGGLSEGDVLPRLQAHELPIYPGSPYFLTPQASTNLIFNFSELTEEQIVESIDILGKEILNRK